METKAIETVSDAVEPVVPAAPPIAAEVVVNPVAEIAPVVQVAPPSTVIPGEDERPCFRTFDEDVVEGGQKYRAGVWYFGVKQSKRDGSSATLTQQWVCSPLHIEAVTTDANGGNFGRQLRFRNTLKSWRTWAMPMELLRGDCNDLRGELLSMGVEIDPYARNLLATYLQSRAPGRRILCALQTGWAGPDFRAFVLPDEVIGPNAASVAYQSGERGQGDYSVSGTLLGWQQEISAMAAGNPMLVLALCAAFAGPLLARVNVESGGIHFVGDSSTGKTTLIEMACSVWGGRGYRRSWRSTANGMEGAALLFNDALLALDEISECDPREVGAIVYALGNGVGKQRATRSGRARPVTLWRASVISSGERTVSTTMADAAQRAKAGHAVRLLDVPVERTYGVFDVLHDHAGGVGLSNFLKQAAATHHGHAGRAFLEKLTRDPTNLSGAVDTILQLPGFATKTHTGQIQRAATRFAVLALAGELATEFGITGWPGGEAIVAAAAGLEAWLAQRGPEKGNLERHDIAEQLSEFLVRHGDSRFSDIDANDDDHAASVRDRAGWWELRNGERHYLLTSEGMREALKGFDFKRALAVLSDLGVINKPGPGGQHAKPRRVRGQPVRLYHVNPGRLDFGSR